MADIAFWTIVCVFALAWGAPVGLILYYRLATVEERFREIRDALIDPDKPAKSPALHYLKLFTRRIPAEFAAVTPTLAAEAAAPNPPAPAPVERKDESAAKKKKKEKTQREQETEALERELNVHLLQFQSRARYTMSVSLLMVFSAAAFFLVWEWTTKVLLSSSPASPIGPVLPIEAVFALAGAYIWSLFELATRARRGNLTPDELFDISIRYLAAVPIGYTAQILDLGEVDAAFAFVAASFPLRDIQRWYRKRTLERMKFEDTPKLESTRAGYLTQVVDGMGPDTVARLEEIGIVTFTDLAYADPIRIMVKAGFSLRHIIQWMDHAMLAIYALDHKQKLALNGITCALDAREFYTTHFVTAEYEDGEIKKMTPLPLENCDTLKAIDKRMEVPALILGEIFGRVTIDPQVQFLAKMWYTGYAHDQLEPATCPGHASEASSSPPAGPTPKPAPP
jgi:hypothetical protein